MTEPLYQNFAQKVKDGILSYRLLYDAEAEWSAGDRVLSLREYLGYTEEEYIIYVLQR
jgi:hypothetical protein